MRFQGGLLVSTVVYKLVLFAGKLELHFDSGNKYFNSVVRLVIAYGYGGFRALKVCKPYKGSEGFDVCETYFSY